MSDGTNIAVLYIVEAFKFPLFMGSSKGFLQSLDFSITSYDWEIVLSEVQNDMQMQNQKPKVKNVKNANPIILIK